ncbi:AMP-binding enzyme family protein (macronuclear) [Tetrahymena thermophila SB210]|uniref:AMP-binding enzyme family protein n=1 Tax=Tetrahymena thermophila (strain SB210) TaxID=312017 RepID=Q237S0_TETTS|nr:AMP-binding enzyme family protein [Tetrahymena thermophila SB210]EAR92671.2 AMP-binding enzyme family protein [Tetrahymena thermophila SB210]|eukprot:XP_001012916.2 AMP-binding enzyme family protein [Tetrahymena thermophila SB210]
MKLFRLDLFSSEFHFNISGQQMRKGTIYGLISSMIIISFTIYYLTYQLILYFGNNINPNYRSQNFISNEIIQIDLNQDLIGFRFEYDVNKNIDILQKKNNQTYLVFLATFFYQNNDSQEVIQIDIIQCTNSNLAGYYCLDFSKLSNYTLALSTKDNILSNISIQVYSCSDIDVLKTFTPDNCASQSDIINIINGLNAGLKIKFLTSQYNTTSQQMQVNYRTTFTYLIGNQYILSTYKSQKQVTQVSQGLFFQSEVEFSSPIQYENLNQSFDREYSIQYLNFYPYISVGIQMDEIVQQIQIQYPMITQILAQVNSVFTLLLLAGILIKRFSQHSIKKDFFVLFLSNFYQDSYMDILEQNNVNNIKQDRSKQQIVDKKYSADESEIKEDKEKEDIYDNNQSQIPSFLSKSKLFLDQSKFRFNKQSYQHQVQRDTNSIENVSQKGEVKENQMQFLQFKHENQSLNCSTFNDSPNLNFKVNEKEKHIPIVNSIQNKSQVFQRNNETMDLSMNQKLGKSIKVQNQMLDESYLAMVSQKIQDKATFKRVYQLLFGFRGFCKIKGEHSNLALSTMKKKKVFDSVNKEIDILKLYKEIFLLKKAVMILLDQEQLATIQLLGCSKDYLDLDFDKQINNELDDSLTHFEKQFAISQSEQLQNKYIQEFFKRCTSAQQLSKIDSRILNSLLKKK